ncbi:MAG: ABC transporter permease [Bacteroidales bacterium]|nr:ABC transporter permease [Bacteroidales bacterium]
MFRNLFKAAGRYILKYQIYTIINIFGLTIGLASSILIYLYIDRQFSYDKFHTHYHQIYRVGVKGNLRGTELNQAITASPLAATLKKTFPDIVQPVRIGRYGAWLVSYGDIRYNEDEILFADSTFFNVFSFPLKKGDSEAALDKSHCIVLTESAAGRYFGNEEPMGKRLQIENDTNLYTITGIMEDIPVNSHFHFDMLASLVTLDKAIGDRWVSHNVYTYFLVKKGADLAALHKGLNDLVGMYVIPELNQLFGMNPGEFESAGNSYGFFLQSLGEIHLKSNLDAELEENGNITFIYIFSVLAILILIVVSINFMNLSTARAAQRSKEVGIRKIMGSGRQLLIRQFLTESVLLSILGMSMALLIVEIILPVFNRYMDLSLHPNQLLNFKSIALLVFLSLAVGLIAGSFPAIFLASCPPQDVLRAWIRSRVHTVRLRKGLVFFQFFVTITCITMTFILFSQFSYLTHKDLGFNKDNLLIIRRSDALGKNIAEFKKNISENPEITAMTCSNSIPGKRFMKSSFILAGVPSENSYILDLVFVGADFIKTFDLELSRGRFFSSDIPSDSFACVLNESAVRLLDLKEPVGGRLKLPMMKNGEQIDYEIIGTVRDFNYVSLERNIGPLVMFLMPVTWEGFITVRISGRNTDETIAFLKDKWENLVQSYPFVSYMLDRELAGQYQIFRKTARIFLILSIIALLIACLGLYGLISFESNIRRREIGIRKALGATVSGIITLLLRQTVLIIAFAALLSIVITCFVALWWLKDYYYHISLNPLFFMISLSIVIIIAFLTIIVQTYFAATLNPGDALKYE